LWEFHVMEGLADGHVALGMKFHHACADALGASATMAFILDPVPHDRRGLPAPVPSEQPPDVRRLAWRGAVRTVSHPVRAARAAGNAVPHLDQVPMMRTLPGARLAARGARAMQRRLGRDAIEPEGFPHAPMTRFNGPLTPERRIAFGHVDVSVVRDLKTAHGVSFNDVVVAAVAGGLRRRLAAGDELPDEPLLAFVPANLRVGGASNRGGNAISSFVVPIPTDLPDPRQRVQEASVAMRRAKQRHALTPPTLMEDANDLVPPLVFGPFAAGIMKLLGTGRVKLPLNLLLSNVPGPPVQMYLDGAPMHTFRPMSIVFPGAALNVTVISYDTRLEIGVIGDRELVSDAWELLEDIEAEFADLAAALEPATDTA
ncbi:MAG: WS/DGAT domain-containing protein, partial [Solirubrobacteraceae bacterium]